MTTARVLPVLGFLTLAVLIVACQRPTSVHVGPLDVTGQWSIVADNATGNGDTCSVNGLSVALTQHDDATFTGTALAGTLICFYMGTETAQSVAGLSVNGTVNAPTRAIGIDVPTVGTLSGTVAPTNLSMSGTQQLTFTVGGGAQVTVTGPWSGTRTSN
jgi:hypothetical protein